MEGRHEEVSLQASILCICVRGFVRGIGCY